MADMITLRYRPPGPVSSRFSVWGGGADDDAWVKAMMGPIGSGKSTACIMEIVGRALRQQPGLQTGKRRSRWAVVRNTYPELKTTTIKSWHQWVPETFGQWQSEGPPTHNVRFKHGNDVIELEVIFLALDRPEDVRKLLSLELSGAWINEAREVPRSILDNLTGRVGRFPPMSDGGPSWSGIILDTNPPDTDGWFYNLFEVERPEGFRLFRQPGGRSPQAENRTNLLPTYYERAAVGKKPEWIRVYIDGEYGVVMDGKPVFPDYRDLVHCRHVPLIPGLPIYVGLDFGLTPAASFGQRSASGQWRVFKELVSESMGIKRFAELLLGPELRGPLAGYEFIITGDPAGDSRAQTDERTPFDILKAAGIPARPAPTNDISLRLEPIEGALTRTIDGEPGFVIDPVGCPTLRKGLAGGYRLRRLKVSGAERFEDKPDKNEFSHVADSAQYMFLGAGEARALVRGKDHAGGQRRSFVGHMGR
jgi:hypothetical protein